MRTLVEWLKRPVLVTELPGDPPRLSPWAFAGLFALCLIPRVTLAMRADTVCDDAFYYAAAARSLESGDRAGSFGYLGLNVHPYVLSVMHRLGFEWLAGGAVWSVLASSLAVLPLAGWVRRLFDDRIALAAGFLYAIHPRLIETGIEPIREPTFWLLFSTSLWLLLRACRSERLVWFVAAGCVAALGIHTRTEGWLLLAPLAVWSATRIRQHPAAWRGVVLGALVCLMMVPAVAVLLNVAMPGAEENWRLPRVNLPVPMAVASPTGGESTADTLLRQAGKPMEIPHWTRLAQRYLVTLAKTLGPGVLVLMLSAAVFRGRMFARLDVLVLGAIAAAILVAVAWRHFQTGALNGRYFLSILLVTAPLDAVGFVLLLRRLTLAIEGRERIPALAPAALLLAGSVAFGWCYALKSEHPGRTSQVRLGNSLRSFLKPDESVLADARSTRIGYVAGKRLPVVLDFHLDCDARFREVNPGLIILSEQVAYPKHRQAAIESAARIGLMPLDKSLLPRDLQDHIVLVRRRGAASPNAD